MALKRAPEHINPDEVGGIIDMAKPVGEVIYRFHCKLVTPMYGGGVDAGEVDAAMPMRATAIRGQLRFWWRLITRNQYLENGRLNSKKQFEAERIIWGGLGDEETLTASKVTLRLTPIKSSEVEECCAYPKESDGSFKTFPK